MKNKKIKKMFYAILVVIVSYLVFEDDSLIREYISGNSTLNNNTNSQNVDGNLKVNYIDVNQGDSIFIELPNDEVMLIDAGEKSESAKVINYIEKLGYEKIDYVIGTHPHTDHIGSLSSVIESFDIGKIYMPKVVSTSKTYENLLATIKNKNLKVTTAKSGVNIINNKDLKIDIIAPVKQYSDLNNNSAVIKLVYKERSFLFMGDAETMSEDDIKESVKSDVIKVGHHGSDSSSSKDFVSKVGAKYAIISVGDGNIYDHPYQEIIERYKNNGAKIYRTDLDGDIVITSDGNNISVSTNR